MPQFTKKNPAYVGGTFSQLITSHIRSAPTNLYWLSQPFVAGTRIELVTGSLWGFYSTTELTRDVSPAVYLCERERDF